MASASSNGTRPASSRSGKFILTLVWAIRLTSCFVYSVTKIVVYAEAEPSVSGTYLPKPRTEVPEGFKDVCVENGWDVEATWVKLNGGGEDGAWYKKESDRSYIYHNALDGSWWIDGPDGLGVYKGVGPDWAPMGMSTAWKAIDGGSHTPTLAIYRN